MRQNPRMVQSFKMHRILELGRIRIQAITAWTYEFQG